MTTAKEKHSTNTYKLPAPIVPLITYSIVMRIVKQLISVLTLLKEKNIVHTYLSSKCIYVSNTNIIKVTKFIYAHNLGSKTTCSVKLAPEEP
jgi:serine/threonine protein kinase